MNGLRWHILILFEVLTCYRLRSRKDISSAFPPLWKGLRLGLFRLKRKNFKEKVAWLKKEMAQAEIRKKEERKEGRKEGRTDGKKERRKEGRKKGKKEDKKEGRKEGRKGGRKKGRRKEREKKET